MSKEKKPCERHGPMTVIVLHGGSLTDFVLNDIDKCQQCQEFLEEKLQIPAGAFENLAHLLATKKTSESVWVQIKCSDRPTVGKLIPGGVRENLELKLLELGRNGFVLNPESSREGYWSYNSGGIYYSIEVMYEAGRMQSELSELSKLGVTPHSPPFP